jgi:hypothetical protein
MNEGRQHDPRCLSRLKPGRSEIQDDAPPIPASKNNRDPSGELRRIEEVGKPPSDTQVLRKRSLRTQGAMPAGSGDGPTSGK